MYYKKTGLPEESEVVMCTVTNIQYSTVFAKLDDYGISGMIHISEIAAGRIRNIRDYVKEDKKIACKVLRVNKERGQVDLSLRRVNERERKLKVNEVKMEQKAEAVIDYVAKQNNMQPLALYNQVMKSLSDYAYLFHAFEDVVAGEFDLGKILDKKLADEMTELVLQRFKVKNVVIAGIMELSTYDGNGVDIVKEALSLAGERIDVKYLGGGKYGMSVEAPDYKEAEPILKNATESVLEFMKKHHGHGEFKRV
ncbi:MAG: S1 RNA-binding domain-containing protein [archaeon]